MRTNRPLPQCLLRKCAFLASQKPLIRAVPYAELLLFPLRIAAGWLYKSSSSRWLIINHVRAHDVMCPAHAVNTP